MRLKNPVALSLCLSFAAVGTLGIFTQATRHAWGGMPEETLLQLVRQAKATSYGPARRSLELLQKERITSSEIIKEIIDLLGYSQGSTSDEDASIRDRALSILEANGPYAVEVLSKLVGVLENKGYGPSRRAISILSRQMINDDGLRKRLIVVLNYSKGEDSTQDAAIRDRVEQVLSSNSPNTGEQQLLLAEFAKRSTFGPSRRALRILQRQSIPFQDVLSVTASLFGYAKGDNSSDENAAIRDLALNIVKANGNQVGSKLQRQLVNQAMQGAFGQAKRSLGILLQQSFVSEDLRTDLVGLLSYAKQANSSDQDFTIRDLSQKILSQGNFIPASDSRFLAREISSSTCDASIVITIVITPSPENE